MKRKSNRTATVVIGPISGRVYRHSRDVGYIENWNPHAKTRLLLNRVNEIMAEYAGVPLSLRQVFYRLVGKFPRDYPKTESTYKNIGETLNTARRAEWLSFEAIRDDTDIVPSEPDWRDPQEFYGYMQGLAMQYVRRPVGKNYCEVWVEAAGMVPQIEAIVNPFGVRVVASSGFSSTTARHNAMKRLKWIQRLAKKQRPMRILFIGDYDPQGCSIMDNGTLDVQAFCQDARHSDAFIRSGMPEFERIALSAEQALEHGLPSSPPKRKQNGEAIPGGPMPETWQAEALDPHVLAELVRNHLMELIGPTALALAKRQTNTERREILTAIASLTG